MSQDFNDANPYASPTAAPIEAFGSEAALQKVASGLNLVYWGIAITLLSILGGVVLTFVAGAQAGAGAAATMALLMAAGIILGSVVGLVGRFFCLAVPEETNAQGIIYAAVACDVLSIVISILSNFIDLPPAVLVVSNFLPLAAAVLFIVFLKRVASFLGRQELADRAQSLITMGIILFVLAILMAVGMFVVGPLVALLVLVILVIALFMFFRYVRLLRDLRSAILGNS